MQTKDDHICLRIMGNALVFNAFLATMKVWFSYQDNDIAQSFVNVIPIIWGAAMILLMVSLWQLYRDKYEYKELSKRWWNKPFKSII